ncbi:MAG TPA: aconitate hydratase AcnA [Chloroflexota bacterium]|nr:aconitate hydratase AcnA [Chloroflexota bacterium]
MIPALADPFRARAALQTPDGQTLTFFKLSAIESLVPLGLDRLPYTVKILLENALRNQGQEAFTEPHVRMLAGWRPGAEAHEFPFLPARVILQDYTGVPVVVDLASMRAAMARLGGDPKRINPLVPVDLVIDHSVQVDAYGTRLAFAQNVEREYERNLERYTLLRWAQRAFQNFRVVPPGTGIVHQVNLEHIGRVVQTRPIGNETVAFPDTLVGTDSHTTMINGLGILGWGVGGIEAEANLLGQPLYLLTPAVVGFRMDGQLPEGTTATDLVLTVTQILRKHGVVNKFVEFYGTGLSRLSLADRATIANMAPEYGATAALFPVDDETLRYLRLTGRPDDLVELVEVYCKEQGLFRTDETPNPVFTEMLELDLSTVETSVAGPKRPQDRVPLSRVRDSLREAFPKVFAPPETPPGDGDGRAEIEMGGVRADLTHGAVVIAAITSCTNTSNPRVMLGAGLLARKAVERGLSVKPYVKTSLAPGSRVVTEYLDRAGLTPYLEALRFHTVGYGCTTCIGNSGGLPEPVAAAIKQHDILAAAVLSGNRNFEGRINPLARPSYLASPPLVVAYALAGTVDIDLAHDPIGQDPSGQDVYLRDIWPSNQEIEETIAAAVGPELFRTRYAEVFKGDERWQSLPIPESDLYQWDPASTYAQEPPYFADLSPTPGRPDDVRDARCLVMLGDSITTDHISPAGNIPPDRPAGRWLIEHGIEPRDFNSYGARRGAHEVMVRGTFGNIRLRNELVPDKEGDWTVHLPSNEPTSIFEASQRYQAEGVPLAVVAGREYGSGSSRDWAAKGPLLLGVRFVIAETYERIHRSNLVGMGVLPLQFRPGEGRTSLGLTGREVFDVLGIASGLTPGKEVTVRARREDGSSVEFQAIARLDSAMDVAYYQHGGILQYVLRQLLRGAPVAV